VDGDDGVGVIVLAGEEALLLDAIELAGQRGYTGFDLLLQAGVFFGEGQLIQFLHFFEVALKGLPGLDHLGGFREFGKQPARLLLVIPEIRDRGRFLQARYALALARNVKDTPSVVRA
jgi:hypothetical protein